MVRLEDIVEKVGAYSPTADLDLIKKAYVFSAMVHQGQTRMSGEPYLSHPLDVADILADLRMDVESVATGLLHDTVEDTHTTVEKIEEVFGGEIAALVDGLTKLSRITFDSKAHQEAENFRKMILAMGKDIRVIIIKLADRLHNMRTLDALPPEKRRKIARETLDIYAPLANRVGMGSIKAELEDLSLAHLEPERYAWIKDKIAVEINVRENYIETVRGIIVEKLKEHGTEGEVTGRPKHIFSINKKMVEQDVEFDNIFDIFAFRVIVRSVRDCYSVLGVIHSTWKPVPGRFKDYIAIPKPNMYQSLHTTVVGPYGIRMEVQIRTEEMHRVAEYGIAAHWKYKEGMAVEPKDEKSFAWLRQLLEWQRDLKDSDEFMESLKVDLFPEEVFIFTPKGDVKEFPVGATPVDFAYAIHTDIGNRCAGARVNGRMVPLKHRLHNGDVVEIITSPTHHPSKDWMKFVVSSRAKTRIRQWIKTEERDKSVTLGRELCEKEFRKHDLDLSRFVGSGEIEKVARESFGVQSLESLFASVGYGKVSAAQLAGKLLPPDKRDFKGRLVALKRMLDKFKPAHKPPYSAVRVQGQGDVMVRFAKCCNPLPGDGITGFVTHGQGVSVHASVCSNLISVDRDRLVDVVWDTSTRTTRPVRIQVISKNEKGLLADMTNAIKAADANISSAEIRTGEDNRAVCTFEVEVMDVAHLLSIMRALEKIKKVIKVERLRRDATKDGAEESAV